MRLSECMAAFRLQLEADGKSPHTVSSYLRDVGMLARFLGTDPPVPGITPDDVNRFLLCDAVQRLPDGRPKKRGSVAKIKLSLRAFFRWAHGRGMTEGDLSRHIRTGRMARPLPVFLTETEVQSLRHAILESTDPLAGRDRVIVELFLCTGLRVSELAALDVADVDLAAGRLTVRDGKGGRPAQKVLNAGLRDLLAPVVRGRAGALFLSRRGRRLSVRQIAFRLELWLRRAGIAKSLGPHGLRHTFATRLYRQTHDIFLVQRAMGHRQIASTVIYTHMVDEDLVEAMEGLAEEPGATRSTRRRTARPGGSQ